MGWRGKRRVMGMGDKKGERLRLRAHPGICPRREIMGYAPLLCRQAFLELELSSGA